MMAMSVSNRAARFRNACVIGSLTVIGLINGPAWAATAYTWSDYHYSPVPVPGLSNAVTTVATGIDHALAVENGAVYAWGSNFYGQLGSETIANSTTPVAVSGMSSGVTAVDAGPVFSVALKNGGAYSWGLNFYGTLGSGSTATRSATPVGVAGLSSGVTAIAAGASHGLAVQNGAVYAWGRNNSGQLGNAGVPVGPGLSSVRYAPVAVAGLTSDVTEVAAGHEHSLAIQNGAAYAWGNNEYGQLGIGTLTNQSTPVAVPGLTSGVTAIAGGYRHALAIRDGAVFAWGSNANGELGNATNIDSSTPVAVDGISGTVVDVSAGIFTSYALTSTGDLWAWGAGFYQTSAAGTTSNRGIPQRLLPPSGYVFSDIGSTKNGQTVISLVSAIPEPASLGVGTLLLLTLARRNRRVSSGTADVATRPAERLETRHD